MGGNESNQTEVKETKQTYQEVHAEQQQEQLEQQTMQPGQLEETRQESMIEKKMRAEAAFWAQHAAPAGAVQTGQRPEEAGMSRKQRRKLAKQREKALKEGRKYSNYADEYTGRIHQDYITHGTTLNVRTAAVKSVTAAHSQEPEVDFIKRRAAVTYLPDYKVDKKGRPASKQDKETALAAQKQAEDYLYGTTEAKNAVLDRIVQQMCAVNLTADMLTVPYIRTHFAELKRLDEKLIFMAQLNNLHPDYFNALPEATKNLWDATRSLSNTLSSWIGNTSEISGLDTAGKGMRVEPIPAAEFQVVRQEQEQDIQTILHIREDALWAYRTAQNGQGEA